jgi:pyruvate kinase
LVAEQVGARAIVTFTAHGHTARLTSQERPPVPIFAFTDSEHVHRQLALWHSVIPLKGDSSDDADTLIGSMFSELVRRGLVRDGDDLVITRLASSEEPARTNFITVRTVGDVGH